jgi:hypothetical protein
MSGRRRGKGKRIAMKTVAVTVAGKVHVGVRKKDAIMRAVDLYEEGEEVECLPYL